MKFLIEDNTTLDPDYIQNVKKEYTGVFYDRFILGLWKAAEGAIYREFADSTESFLVDEPPDEILFATLGLDFGGNGSANAVICTGFSAKLKNVVVLDEYYRKEIISPVQLENDVCDFIRKCRSRYRIADMYCDSAEQILIEGLKTAIAREEIPINIHNARKSEIVGRIRFFNAIISQKRFYVMRHCKHVTEALQSAVWDKRKLADTRLDDGTYNIDSLDAMEYSAEPYMKDILRAEVL